MPKTWRDGLKALGVMPLAELRFGLSFVRRLGLEEFSYLDALFLIESARRQATANRQVEQTSAMVALLYALPLLYVDDQIWWRDDADKIANTLFLFDQALRLDAAHGLGVKFPVRERAMALSLLQGSIFRRLAKHPTALATPALRRRYFARLLHEDARLTFWIATTAYHPPSKKPVQQLGTWEPTVDERLWRWAWHVLRFGDPFVRTVDLEEVQQVWTWHQAHKEE